MRICSFLPSATEMVYSLGLGGSLYGVTHECDYPPQAKQVRQVVSSIFQGGDYSSSDIHAMISERLREEKGIYDIDEEAILEIRPDLLLSQELCAE